MARQMSASEWLKGLVKDHFERINHCEDEIRSREDRIEAIQALIPFTVCKDCGAESMGDMETAEQSREAARKLGKTSMVCIWCDRRDVFLYQIKEYNVRLASSWGTEESAERAAINFIELAFA